MLLEVDHPLLRKQTECPVCKQHKDKGLVTCWACYRLHNLRNGNALVELLLDGEEAFLRRTLNGES